MDFHFFSTFSDSDHFMILPTLTLDRQQCENLECDAVHYYLTCGWFFWGVAITWSR